MKSNNMVLKKTTSFIKKEYARVAFLALIFIFCILPLVILLFNIKGNDLNYVFSDNTFYNSLKNSLLYSIIAATLSTCLALVVAYFLNKANIRHKKVMVTILTLSMLIPTISIGLGIRTLFGENGFLSKTLGLVIDYNGYFGLIFGSIIISFPPTFLIVYDSLQYENKAPYDVAKITGVSEFKSFFKITLPYLKRPLIAAFFASFTLIFSDYGIPMEVAGNLKTLPMYLYEQVLSTFQYGRGSIVGLFLLIPALLSFLVEILFKDNHSEQRTEALILPSKIFNKITVGICVFITVIMFLPSISFICLAFMKGYPNNISFSFENILNMFTGSYGIGLSKYILNSIAIATITCIIGTIIAFVIAYFTTRIKGKLGRALHFFSIASIAIPGLVLGIGYILIFKDTNGFFYGTIAILVAVNIAHFIGQPYIMAKNCLEKIDKEFEVIGNTLGVSRVKIFFGVILPNSKITIIEMLSYFFINSMITISAVAFLCTYKNQPLAILITSFEKSGNYEMQAVVSLFILILNCIFKLVFILTNKFLLSRTKENVKGNIYMGISRYQFEILTYLEHNGNKMYSTRFLSNELCVSVSRVTKEIEDLMELGWLQENSLGEMSISDKGLEALEPYKVKRAIVLAAGFGSRMAPVTLNTPKPLVRVNGTRIIDTLLDSLIEKEIHDIILIVGYKKEQFQELLEKYPMITVIENSAFNVTNNISSLMQAVEHIDRCYICEADLVISNKDLIRKYEFSSNYLGAKVNETDDWCFYRKHNYIHKYQQGGENCYQAFGISYWDEEDCAKLRMDLKKVYNSRGGKEKFWDAVPLKVCRKNYKVEVRKCSKADIVEIDNFSELVAIDSSYKNYPDHEKY